MKRGEMRDNRYVDGADATEVHMRYIPVQRVISPR